MPGIVIFRRRWSIGSDDLVVPMIFMIVVHLTWLVSLAIVRGVVHFDAQFDCTVGLRDLILGHLVILAVCVLLETVIAIVSTRGSILVPAPRASIEYFMYTRLVVGLVELAWLIMGAVWSSRHYTSCSPDSAKKALLGMMICNWLMVLILIISLWCTFDSAGRKWVKMKKFQDSMKERRQERRRGTNRRQSGSRRNWRQRSQMLRDFFFRRMQRKAFRAYEESWDRRLQLLCCCVERKGHNRNSMSEIAALFTDFFRDLDVVPSDIVAGMVLLRKHQQERMNTIISQGNNDVYQFLSGVPITPQTRFLQLSQPDVLDDFQKVIHYMRFALAVYGWPVYVMVHPGTWCCRLLPLLRCCCKKPQNVEIVDDNCCLCNFSTAKKTSGLQNLDLVYCTYHVDIGETPFFVALDHVYKKVVVAVRGTLSLQDVLTDLKAEPETLPLNPPRDDWQGHKGMMQAAVYIKKKLINDGILQMAWDRDEAYTNSGDWLKSERETAKYDLVLVGHSLGAGTAAILAILLKADYPNLHCYSYSPPGGLLTLPCVEETKPFITSVVVGKDCVPRVGLPQLEMLRADILNHIKNTSESKWKIISKGLMCCGRYSETNPTDELLERDVTAHPSNSAIGLSAHAPLYPPGQMIHVVRSHIKSKRTQSYCSSSEPIYQAVWASNGDFDEVLVSPTMVNDHMPDNVLEALEKVVMKVAPEKPVHTLTEEQRRELLSHPSVSSLATPTASEVNNSSERTQNARGSEDSNSHINGSNFGGNGEVLMEDDETSALFGMHKSEIEDLVKAPLASPETLSLASGVAVFSPSSSMIGRDGMRQSLQRCAEKQLESPSETPDSNDTNSNKNQSGTPSTSTPPLSGNAISKGKENGVFSVNHDVEAGNSSESDNHRVKFSAGNTISVKAEVVNEMVNQSVRAPSSTLESKSGISDVIDNIGQSLENPDSSSAILEPSSHIHVVSPSHQKLVNLEFSNPLLHPDQMESVDPSNSLTVGSNKPGPPVDLGLNAGWEFGGDQGRGDDRAEVLDSYTRHSPLESNQHEYAHPNIYYSQAGIGYPHNAFHPPMRFYSFPEDKHVDDFCNNDGDEIEEDGNQPLISRHQCGGDTKIDTNLHIKKTEPKRRFTHAESESNLLSHKRLLPQMKRSAEQDDIVHLCDALEVFESEEDKVRLCQSSDALHDEEIEGPSNLDECASSTDVPAPPVKSKSSNDLSLLLGGSSVTSSSQAEDSYRTDVAPVGHSEDSFAEIKQQSSFSDFEDTNVFKFNQKDIQTDGQDENCPLLSNRISQEINNESSLNNLAHNLLHQGDVNSMQETHL